MKITETEFCHGVNVVQMGEYRISRGMTRRKKSTCRHYSLVYDDQERKVWCNDCESNLDSYDAFLTLVESFNTQLEIIYRKQAVLDKDLNKKIGRIAAQKLDDIWKTNRDVPCCPNCDKGMLAEDFATKRIKTVWKKSIKK